MPPIEMLALHRAIGIDIIYSFVIIFSSLLIYYSTKEIYELSNHKGIKYFRVAFIFFALAYAFRFLTQFFIVFLGFPRAVQINPEAIGALPLILFLYSSTTAIFYLFASVHWKLFENKYSIFILHLISILITLICITTRNLPILLLIQAITVIFLAFSAFFKRNQNKKHNIAFVLYILLAVFWMLNLLDILLPDFFQTIQLLTYLASITIFLILLYRVTKKL
jgi:hypothetical protein